MPPGSGLDAVFGRGGFGDVEHLFGFFAEGTRESLRVAALQPAQHLAQRAAALRETEETQREAFVLAQLAATAGLSCSVSARGGGGPRNRSRDLQLPRDRQRKW